MTWISSWMDVYLPYECARCGAEVGAHCVTVSGYAPGTITYVHQDRVNQHWRAQATATEDEVAEALASIASVVR